MSGTKKDQTVEPGVSKREAELEGAIKLKDDEIAGLRDAVHELELKVAITKVGGSEKLLLPALKATTELRHENGSRTVVVMAGGEPRLKADARTVEDYLPLQDWLAEMRLDPEYLPAFGSRGVSGGGTRPVRTAQRRQRVVSRDDPLAIGRNATAIARGDVKVR